MNAQMKPEEVDISPSNSPSAVSNETTAPEITANRAVPNGPAGPSLAEQDAFDEFIIFLFQDGLGEPIEGLGVEVKTYDGTIHEGKTCKQGSCSIPKSSIKPKPGQKITVRVKDYQGGKQEICTLDAEKCSHGAIIHSPKVLVKTRTESHHQGKPVATKRNKTAPLTGNTPKRHEQPREEYWYNFNLDKAWEWVSHKLHIQHNNLPKTSGVSVLKGNTPAGNPVHVVLGPEAGGLENLLLKENNRYRDVIIEAGKRACVMPQAIAALINAEAAKKKTVVPVLKDGKPIFYQSGPRKGKPVTKTIPGGWDEKSDNGMAAGLTQFIKGTWLDSVVKSGFFIQEESAKHGWVRKAEKGGGFVFVLNNGQTTPAPYKHLNDINAQACLEMRFDPRWSILAAADYGKANLASLSRKGYKIHTLNDCEKAKIMYLMHHEGPGGERFINGTLNEIAEPKLRKIFNLQVGSAESKKWIESNGNDLYLAYYAWLCAYIDKQIRPDSFAEDKSKIPAYSEIDFIVNKLRISR